jgi:hypothetical protein
VRSLHDLANQNQETTMSVETAEDLKAWMRDSSAKCDPSSPASPPEVDLGCYRTGEVPMVGDVVRLHDEYVDGWKPCTVPFDAKVTRRSGRIVSVEGHEEYYAARFDLISRAEQAPASPPERVKSTYTCSETNKCDNCGQVLSRHVDQRYCPTPTDPASPPAEVDLRVCREGDRCYL